MLLHGRLLHTVALFVGSVAVLHAEVTAEQAKQLATSTPVVQRARVPRKHFILELTEWDKRFYVVSVYDTRGVGAGTGGGKFGLLFVDRVTGLVYDSAPFENPIDTALLRRLRRKFLIAPPAVK